jgi:hypothetical protein
MPRVNNKSTAALKEHAQNGHGVKRAAPRTGDFLHCLAVRIRALCALKLPVFKCRKTLENGKLTEIWPSQNTQSQKFKINLTISFFIYFNSLRAMSYGPRPNR